MPVGTLHELQRATPESQGIASAAVLRLVEALESQTNELHSLMLLRHGSVVAEGWWSPYLPEQPHIVFSLSKSFTASAVGLAVSEGYFTLESPVLSFFPDEAPVDASDFLQAMCVRHLLSMSTGHTVDTWSNMFGRPDGNWIRGFFEVPVTQPPGTFFLYNTGATYMLAAIVERTTRMTVLDYLEPRLFAPLGIHGASWQQSPEGITMGGIGLSLKTEDIARFGQLYLQKGRWQGKQLLPESWVEEATAIQSINGDDPDSDWAQGYGFQFWRCRHGAYRGDGVFGQYCIVMPEQDAVLAITGGVDLFEMQKPLDLIWEILLPAMGSEHPAEDAEAYQRMKVRLSGLQCPVVEGQADSLVGSRVSDRTYIVDDNALKLREISFDFGAADCTIRLKTDSGDEVLPCGYGTWLPGQTTLFNDEWVVGVTPVMTCGAWTAEDVFTLVVRLVETPFVHTLGFHFLDSELLIQTQVNVSFEAPEAQLLSAHHKNS
ncbi:MAG: serine hydrolase [bacterium]|nr:serine hydrolase [bacterium]